MPYAIIINDLEPFTPQLRKIPPDWLPQFSGERLIYAPRLLPGFAPSFAFPNRVWVVK